MQQHQLTQGSPEWIAHRTQCWNASDAPAMMGCSPYETRAALIRRIATGITPDVDAGTQRLFNDGHRFEALERPRAEAIVGDDLSPLSGSIDTGLSRPVAASFDGLTFMRDTNWEHKSLNDALRAVLPAQGVGDETVGAALPLNNRVQLEQQMLVSGAERSLFTASKWDGDTLVEERHCWYVSDPALRVRVLAGWAQFEKDVAAYQPPEAAAPVAIAQPVAALPVVFDMRVEGRLVSCNLEKYKPAALAYIQAINTELTTDQQFADADADAKFCRESASKLETSIELALGQMGDINAAISTVREIAAAFNAKGLALEKLVKSEKDRRKTVIVMERQAALREHCDGLTRRVGVPVSVATDFAGVIKGLKSIASMEDKLDTELARAKIAASQVADLIDGNRKAMDASDAGHLFPDFAQVCTKTADDFANLITSRRAAAQARADAERERIRAEEAARLEREQRAEAERKAREEADAKARADAEAKAKAEAEARAARDEEAKRIELERDTAAAVRTSLVDYTPAPAPAPEVRTFARAAAPSELPTLTLGEIKTRIAPLSIDAAGLESLGFPAKKERGACLYRNSDWPAIHAALVKKLTAAGPQQLAA